MGNKGASSGKAGGGSTLNSAQKEALNKYRERMTTASKVKYERIKSLAKQDGIFLDDDNLKKQVANRIGNDTFNTASIDKFRYLTVPDKKRVFRC